MLYPVILTGGVGARLWPLSRKALPKPLLPLTSSRSLLQETVLRLHGLEAAVGEAVAVPSVVCNQEHRFLIGEQFQELGVNPHVLMLEPAVRNTAPALAAAALYLHQQDPDALLLVLASDHVIQDTPGFHRAIGVAAATARDGYLCTFGIVPQAPETGYGYLEVGEELTSGACKVRRFVEKPDAATAERYVASGGYLWNSGMFLFRADVFLTELEGFAPAIVQAVREAVAASRRDLDFLRLAETEFERSPSESIDYAVMEKTARAAVVPADIGWSDLGSWASLWEVQPKDANGNVTQGPTLLEDVKNCYVTAERRLVAALGVEDLVIVETPDAVLVARKDRSQDVKKLVDRLAAEGRKEHVEHRKMYRPWGSYEGIDREERFQVKRITVKPGARLSMQQHHHRSEHWVVVHGTAEVTVGDTVRLLTENESVYIPLGAWHRLHNPGRIPLHLVEVQSGSYLEEDDIVRTDDVYGRQQ